MRLVSKAIILVLVAFLGVLGLGIWQTNMIHKQEVITCYDKITDINGKLPPESQYNPYQSQSRNSTLDEIQFDELNAEEIQRLGKSDDLPNPYTNARLIIGKNAYFFEYYSEKYPFLRYELLLRISRTCSKDSVYSEVSRTTLSNIKQYFWMIQNTYESLHKCKSILVPDAQNEEPSYKFGLKNDELLQGKNVLMYKRIRAVLVGSENKLKVMAIIDVLLYYVFNLSNLCLKTCYVINYPPILDHEKLFEETYSVEHILDGKKPSDKISDIERKQRIEAGEKTKNRLRIF